MALTAKEHSLMAEAFEKVATDPKLTPEKRQEYLGKATKARDLAQEAKVLESARWRHLARLARKR
jgi:hypothetical protein